MSGSSLIHDFLSSLASERSFSDHTIRNYGVDLRQFCQFLAAGSAVFTESATLENLPLIDESAEKELAERILAVTADDIRAYVGLLHRSLKAKSTIARKLAALRSFYKYLVRRERLEASPVTVVRTPRQDRRLPKCLDVKQIETLLGALDVSNLSGARDKAILETIYSGGLRVSEAVGLNLADVDELGETLRIRGKGKKERLAPWAHLP